MNDSIRVTVVQSKLSWEASEQNLKDFDGWLDGLAGQTDVVLLPEMFTSGFTLNTEACAEAMDGPGVSWMRAKAAELDAVVAGSIIIEENGRNYNRFVWMQPDGQVTWYNKRHLFRMAHENEHFDAGTERKVVDWRGFRFNLQVCYDLRFPVFARNRRDDRYDVLLYVANWPEARRDPWMTLLKARAIENQAYVVGVNRVGIDGIDITYSGDSLVLDPKGQELWSGKRGEIDIATVTLDLAELNRFREQFPVGDDADDFQIL